MVDFSKSFQFFVLRISQSYNPGIAVTIPVWAPSISLAATLEIEFSFFSSPYLDVSVQAVPDVWLWIHHTTEPKPERVRSGVMDRIK